MGFHSGSSSLFLKADLSNPPFLFTVGFQRFSAGMYSTVFTLEFFGWNEKLPFFFFFA